MIRIVDLGHSESLSVIPRPRAILFDLDNTILDSGTFHVQLVRLCGEVAGDLSASGRQVEVENRRVFDRIWMEHRRAWLVGDVSGDWIVTETWRRTLRSFGVYSDELLRAVVLRHHALERRAYRPYPDARTSLEHLAGHARLGIVTNGASDSQRSKLDVLQFDKLFSSIVVSGEIGFAKPDVAIFLHAVTQLGCEPPQVWLVGDDLESDIAGGLAAGLSTIWIDRRHHGFGRHTVRPNAVVHSLDELAPLADF